MATDPQKIADINRDVIRDIRSLHGMRKSDEFEVESQRIIADLQERGLTEQADIISEYAAKDPGSLSTKDAIAARSDAQSAINQITENAFAEHNKKIEAEQSVEAVDPESRKVTAQDITDQISEGLAGVREVLKGVTPEFLSQKFDEEMNSPETIALMREKNINPDDVMAKKGELIENLHSELQTLSESDDLKDAFEKDIEGAIQDLPGIVDKALSEALTNTMDGLDGHIQDAFNRQAQAREAANNDPRIADDVEASMDPTVLSIVKGLLDLKEGQPEQYEVMKNTFGDSNPNMAEAIKFIESMPQESAPANEGGGGMRP